MAESSTTDPATCPETELSEILLALKGLVVVGSYGLFTADYKPPYLFSRREESAFDAMAILCANHPQCDRAAIAVERTPEEVTLYIATEPPAPSGLREDIEMLLDNPTHPGTEVDVRGFIRQAYSFVYEMLAQSIPQIKEDLVEHTHEEMSKAAQEDSSYPCPAPALMMYVELLEEYVTGVLEEEDRKSSSTSWDIHQACLWLSQNVDDAEQGCILWAKYGAPSRLAAIRAFSTSVSRVVQKRSRLRRYPWKIVWATAETLPAAANVERSSLQAWLHGYDLEDEAGNKAVFDWIIKYPHSELADVVPSLHAESALIRTLLHHGVAGDFYLGTSADTCYPCHEYMNTVNATCGTQFTVRACSGDIHFMELPIMSPETAQHLRDRFLRNLRTHFERIGREDGGYDDWEELIRFLRISNPEYAKSLEKQEDDM